MKFTNRRIVNTIIISTLLVASIASIGFSSWLIGKENNDSVNIDASVGEIKDTNYFVIGNINMFSLGPDGLVEDYTIVKSSNISIEFYINNALAYEFTNNGILSFNMTLRCTDQNFINTYIASPTINNSINVASTFIDNELNSSVQYEISSVGTTTVNVIYEVTDVGDANNMYMADLYYSNKPTFSFSIRSN